MSAPSWVTANMSEMSCGCWRLFPWQWCSMLCQSGLHLGPLENDLWQTRPVHTSRSVLMSCSAWSNVTDILSFRTSAMDHLMCDVLLLHFSRFYKQNNVSCKWLTSGDETILRSTGRVYEIYDNVSGLQQLKGAIFPQVNFLKLLPFYFPPEKMYS